MAETVKILSPQKKVLLSDSNAGCPMAEQMDKDLILQLKEMYPDYKVVAYINEQTKKAEAEGKKVGIICTEESRDLYPDGNLEVIGSREHEETVAHNLFAVLRDFDARKVDCIFSESFSKDQLGQAIMNRLCKAAGDHIINV